MPITINRDALIIFPKQPLLDWVNSVFDDEKIDCPKLMAHDQGNVYLIPQADHTDEGMEFLKENYQVFLEEELYSWCTDESQWPEEVTWEMFQQWFHISIQSMVLDSIDEPLERDEY